MRSFLILLVFSCCIAATPRSFGQSDISDPEAVQLIRAAMDQWRGLTSRSQVTMIIHRTDWERSMTMNSWSSGDDLSLVRVVEPKKDAGNGTLLNDDNMWSFSPKINRIIKIPSSMMNQSWMGSDFSNRDISKSTDIIDNYTHQLSGQRQEGEHTIYTITSIPHEDAAVVWGKEVNIIRDDFVTIQQQFWDQDNVLVKQMNTLEIAEMGGRAVAKTLRMHKTETPEEWTELRTNEVEFDIELPENLFTLSNLRNPRQ
jgi:outer membrane lipoprotein-sorting protein